MKNTIKILAIALAALIGFSFAACGGTSGGPTGGDYFTSNLSGKTLTLIKNEWSLLKDQSKGLQGQFRDQGMMQGKKINKGDVFKLNIRFKIDKVLDDDIWVMLIDFTAVNNWKDLSYRNPPCIAKDDLPKDANTVIEYNFTFTATESASDNSPEANTLVFDCGDLWSKAPVTITFVSFTFTKVDPSSGDSGDGDGSDDNVNEPGQGQGVPPTEGMYSGFFYGTEADSRTIIHYEGAGGDVEIPAQILGKPVTSIGDGAFEGCENLTSVNIPNSVTRIGDRAFADCENLINVTIGNSVTSIGGMAFNTCTSLTSITLPDSITGIGVYAFIYCGLTSVTFQGTIPSEDFYDAFEGDLRDKFYETDPDNGTPGTYTRPTNGDYWTKQP